MAVERKVGDRVMRVVVGDITDMELEAFVYDVMDDAKLGTGYGTAIMGRAGKVVQDELEAIGACPKGEAIVTSAGQMEKTKHIIHVNGPKFHENDQEGKLRSAVTSALRRAEEKGVGRASSAEAFDPLADGIVSCFAKSRAPLSDARRAPS